jgi:hypothetical protein
VSGLLPSAVPVLSQHTLSEAPSDCLVRYTMAQKELLCIGIALGSKLLWQVTSSTDMSGRPEQGQPNTQSHNEAEVISQGGRKVVAENWYLKTTLSPKTAICYGT